MTFSPPTLPDLRALVATVQQLSLARSVLDVQLVVRSAARALTGADGASFVLRDGASCHYVDEDAISPLWKGQRFPVERCISGWAMQHRQPVVIEDIYADDRVPHDFYRPTFVRSLVIVPIRTIAPVGAIGCYWSSRYVATPAEVELLQAVADSTAVALENVRVYRLLDEARVETLRHLALAAEYRDDATYAHTERVAHLAFLIATRLGLSSSECALIREAAPLHDIGKLAISDVLLLKPGRLTEDEIATVKTHATAGANLLADTTSDVLRLAGEIALSHHEWWNGSGYPNGLRGEAIPLSGRIVAVADVFDALVHSRPYKPAWPVRAAVDEVKRLRRCQFDPAVVEAFVDIPADQLADAAFAMTQA
jgi:hypothetical protein